MTAYNVPRARYNYALSSSAPTDDIDVRVQPNGGAAGFASLTVTPKSPGAPLNQGQNVSLTGVHVRIAAPRCLLDTLIPEKKDALDAGLSGGGQVAHWSVGNLIKDTQKQYKVNYVAAGPAVRRLEFVLEANELLEPIRLQLDLTPGSGQSS